MTDAQPVPGTPATPALANVKRARTVHLRRAKDSGEKFSMLTSYDVLTAGIFDRSGVDVLLVGDSLGNTVLGHESTLPVTLEDMVVFAAAVVRGVQRALVVVDLPFGSYEESPAQAVRSAARIMKETGAHAVKLEGGEAVAEHIAAVVRAGIPVMGHVGFTPQSEHALGASRAAAGPPSSCSGTPAPCRTPGASPWSWRWCPRTPPPRSRTRWRSPPWASARET